MEEQGVINMRKTMYALARVIEGETIDGQMYKPRENMWNMEAMLKTLAKAI